MSVHCRADDVGDSRRESDHFMPTATFQRTPLVVTAGSLTAGPVHATFRDGDPESLLHSYLVLVRQLRGQQRQPTITLRGSDISALADHLGSTDERVLDDLLGRMGATRAQRKALLALFAVGALSIVATGSVALDLAPAGVFAEGANTPAPVTETVDLPAQVVAVAVEAPTSVPAPTVTEPAPEAELAIARGGADWEYTVALHLLTQALATQPPADLDDPLPEGVGVADDGSTVAVAAPPVPPVEGVGVADDGSTVAVAPPPTPPVEGLGVADDGSTVAVGLPPVPPAP